MKPSAYPPTRNAGSDQNSTYRTWHTGLFTALVALAAMFVLSGTPARAQTFTNYLANPGFEAGGTTGWSMVPPWTWNPITSYCAVQNTNSLVYGSPTIHATVHGGTNAMKIWGYNQNTYTTTPGLQQTIPAAAGSTWTADGWVSTQVPDNIRLNSASVSETAYLRVMFLDGTTNYNIPLASYTSPAIDNTSPTSTWIHLQVTDGVSGTTLAAPEGTAFVRFEMIFSQPSTGGVNPGGSSYWDDVQLFKTSKPDPEITVQPAPVEKIYGQTAVFSVVADGTTALSYNWQKDGSNITDPNAYGVHTATLTLSNVTSAMSGNYTVTVTDQAGALTSSQAYLMVHDPGVLSITPPLGQTVAAGTNITITVAAAGSSTLTYAWYKDGNPLANNGHYSGVTGPTLSISSVTAADNSTNYTVYVNGGAASAASGLKVVSPSTNLLANAGFEDGVISLPWETSWGFFNGVVIASTNDYYYLSADPVSVHGGTYVCQVYGRDADDGYNQSVAAIPGATYHAGGWFYMSHNSPVAGPVTVTMQVMFKDAGNNTLAQGLAPQITTNFVTDTWTLLQATNGTGGTDLVAPAGTVSVTVQVYEYNWSYAGGSVYADDLSLTASLPPPSPVTITPSVIGGLINLSFPTTTGVTYEVLYADSLTIPNTWHTNSTIAGNGAVRSASDSLGAAKRFYRVLEHY
jgi:hypothetical protein